MASDETVTHGQRLTLSDGNQIPVLGLGVWQVPDGPECENAVAGRSSSATATSTRPRPTATRRASGRRCATAVCRATRCSSRRSSIPGQHDPAPKPSKPASGSASTRSTSTSSTGPRADRLGVARNGARGAGLARAIGVSNFSVQRAEEVLRSRAPPVVNQVQFSPFEYRRGLLESPRAARRRPRGLQPARDRAAPSDRSVAEIAERVGRKPAQVLLRWCIQHGVR